MFMCRSPQENIAYKYILTSPEYHVHHIWMAGGGPRGVMIKTMDCGIVVSEFELQSLYYVHFRANTLGKSMNPLILLAMR